MTGIGKKIKEIRMKRSLSQENLAESAKVNLRTIQRIENNETTPRGKTLKLIFDALDIEVIEVEKEKIIINKYLIWSSFLTLLIIICSFLGWMRFLNMLRNGERVYRTFTGWNGSIRLGGIDFENWLLSISTITIGLTVLSHSLGLINNKMKYIALQLMCVFLYLIALISSRDGRGEIRPSLFIVLVASILLVIAYRKKKKKQVLTRYKNNC